MGWKSSCEQVQWIRSQEISVIPSKPSAIADSLISTEPAAGDSGGYLLNKTLQPSSVQFTVKAIVMIWNYAAWVEFAHALQTDRKFLRATVQKGRREMDAEPIAGEEIAGEEEIEAIAVKGAVSLSVTGKMENAQAAPVGQFHLRREKLVDRRAAIMEGVATGCLHQSAETGGAGVGIVAIDMWLFERMSEDGGARQLLESRQISGVIEMAVGEEDGPDPGPIHRVFLQYVL